MPAEAVREELMSECKSLRIRPPASGKARRATVEILTAGQTDYRR